MIHKTLTAAVLGGFLLVGCAMPSFAANNCDERVRRAEEKLNKEVQHHGEHSKQAENARRDVERERQNCRNDQHRDNHHDNDHHDYNH